MKQDSSLLDGFGGNDDVNALISKGAQMFPLIALGVAVVCILCPFRLIINKYCIRGWDIKEANKAYDKLVTSFPTDYDKENPLTKKQGDERWLQI